MGEEKDGSAEDEPAHFTLDDVRDELSESNEGMSLERLEEIEDARERGEPIEVTEEEEQEIARFKESMDQVRRRITSMVAPKFDGIGKQLRDVHRSSSDLEANMLESFKNQQAVQAKWTSPPSATNQFNADFERIAEQRREEKQEQYERETQTAANISVVADALEQMNATQKRLYVSQQAQKRIQKRQRKSDNKRANLMIVLTAVAAFGGLAGFELIGQWTGWW